MSINNYAIENNTHECQQCGMKFYNSAELVNHIRKFCSGAGLNSLEGLAQYQHSTNMSKKLKNYGAHSLGAMKYEPVFSASQLAKQAKQVADHREQLAANRPYSNANSQAMGKSKMGNYNQTDLGMYQRSIVKKVQMPQTKNSRAGYGERILGNSEVSMQSLGGFRDQPSKKNLYGSKSDNQYYSPPSDVPLFLAKHNGPSVLDKSNSSIAKMSVSQKHDYATDKLVQLDNIAELYDKSGGMSMDFRKNLQKMRKFYKKMLEDDQPTKQYPGQFAISRVQTPINKLRDLNADENPAPKDRRNQPKDSLDQHLNQNKKLEPQPNIKKSKTDNNSNSLPNYMGYQQPSQYPYYPPPYNPYPPQPQIIMMPPYQQNQPNNDINEQIKYFQKVIEVKNQENKKLMQMLLETKKQKNQSQVRSKVQQIRQSRITEMRSQNNIYHMETPMESMPLTEEKILLALQRQQLDQLRLLSALPEQLQQLKMQSVMKLIEQRTELEKEILQQKVRRLEQQKRNQLHEEQVRLEKDEWANEQRKKLIGYQMGDVLEQFKRKVHGENDTDEEQSEQEYNGGEGDGQQE